MNGDIAIIDQERPIVSSVGNAWVICNSKSRPGFKYYFNTLSGHAVWNLSPDEIEKAKKYTNALPISEIEKCPEPSMDPPMDPMLPAHAATSRIYNEAYIRGQIPNQIPNIFPMGLLDVNSMPGVSNIRGLNPMIWNNNPLNNSAVPPTPIIYVAYPQMNMQPPQECPQNFHTINEDLESYRKTYNARENDMFDRNIKLHDMRGQRFVQRNMQQTSNWNRSSLDLRQKLIRKRSQSLSSESGPFYERNEEDSSYQDFHVNNRNVGVQRNTEENISKYDLSVLKQLKGPHSKARCWFIVVDTEIVLGNFPFLNKIIDPEQDCYLMLPDHVMKELQQLVSIGGDVQTRRILRFLSQQIETELAFRGEDLSKSARDDEDSIYKTWATCEKIADNNNVILLSNDAKYQRHKNDHSNIHIFNLDEFKQILKAHVKRADIRLKSPTLGIKIVVPNDTRRNKIPPIQRPTTPDFDVQTSKTSDFDVQTSKTSDFDVQTSKTTDFEVRPFTPKEKETIQTHSNLSSKLTAENIKIMSNEFTEKHIDDVAQASVGNVSVEITKRPKTPNFSNVQEKKEIKLSRSTSCTSNAESTQTRQYRWRKRRDSNKTKTKSLSVTSDQASIDLTRQRGEAAPLFGGLKQENSLRSLSLKPISPTKAPSVSRSSVSSIKDTSRLNIVIEETSTSGIISNTTMDSDIVNTYVKRKKTVDVSDDVDFEMFEISGPSMEEVLRTRREEWVLRFVQIMEETLKEILRSDSPFQSKCYEYSPPWAADLPELATCVIKRFSDHFNVVDAANRLSFKLHKITNSQGANIEPKQYMEMYSFGVYLINSLKNATEDCEDLNAAHKSLKKLMFDIQNANLDTCHNDTFVDELDETAINATILPNPYKKGVHKLIIGAKESVVREHNNINSERSMLPPRKGNETQINDESLKQHITNIETKFFSSLALAKKTNTYKPCYTDDLQRTHTPEATKDSQTPPIDPSSSQTSHNSPSILKTTTHDVSPDKDSSITNTDKDNTSNMQICFVRNFSSIPQFEEILNKKGQSISDETPMDDEYDNENYDDNAYANDYYDQDGELYGDVLEDGEIEDEEETVDDMLVAPNDKENLPEIASTEKLDRFIKQFTDEIRRSIQIVMMLCTELRSDLKSSHEPSQQLQDELRSARTSMSDIKNELTRILDTESTTTDNNIMHMLKKANLHNNGPNKELLLGFINIISKCSVQVNTCYEKVTRLMQLAGIQFA